MAKPLSFQPLTNYGVNGLNTQVNPATLDPSWLTAADNIVLRESGRISFRKGFKQKVVPSDTAIASITEHNDQGTNKIFASYGTSIYTIDFTTPAGAFPTSTISLFLVTSLTKKAHLGLSPSCNGTANNCPCFNFGKNHLTS